MKKLFGLVVLALPVVAFAADGDLDFTPITVGVSLAGVAVAIIAMNALKMGPVIAKWASGQLVRVFGR